MTQTSPRFACECGKTFRWKPEIAGRKAQCPCGRKLDVPKTMDEPEEIPSLDTFDFADEEPAKAPPVPQRAPAIAAKTGAAIKSMSTPAAKSAPAAAAAAASMNWKGAIWLFVGCALAVGGAVKHVVDPHDPSLDNGRRVRAWESVINVVYDIGGNGAVIAAFALLALALAGLAYATLMNKLGTSDE
jgi:hypothetical protein